MMEKQEEIKEIEEIAKDEAEKDTASANTSVFAYDMKALMERYDVGEQAASRILRSIEYVNDGLAISRYKVLPSELELWERQRGRRADKSKPPKQSDLDEWAKSDNPDKAITTVVKATGKGSVQPSKADVVYNVERPESYIDKPFPEIEAIVKNRTKGSWKKKSTDKVLPIVDYVSCEFTEYFFCNCCGTRLGSSCYGNAYIPHICPKCKRAIDWSIIRNYSRFTNEHYTDDENTTESDEDEIWIETK